MRQFFDTDTWREADHYRKFWDHIEEVRSNSRDYFSDRAGALRTLGNVFDPEETRVVPNWYIGFRNQVGGGSIWSQNWINEPRLIKRIFNEIDHVEAEVNRALKVMAEAESGRPKFDQGTLRFPFGGN